MINLPRQAWDKHRESTQERDAFSQANATYFALADFQRSGGGGSSSYIAREGGGGEPEPETADGQAAAAAAVDSGWRYQGRRRTPAPGVCSTIGCALVGVRLNL